MKDETVMDETGADGTGAGDGAANVLSVERLTTRFATPRGELLAVDDVSLQVAKGETLGIVGESGSGKSVLVRSVMNILPRTARLGAQSRILVAGADISRLDPARARHFFGVEVAMIFQDPMTSLNPVKKIGLQITDPLRFHLRMGRDQARARAIELLADVGIADPARRFELYPHQLSGGMRQRVAIAIALSCEPKLLVADEPTTALDVTVQRQILDLLQSIQARLGMGMILITHDLGVVAARADRVGVMYAGRLVETAPTPELFAHPRHPYTSALMRSIPRLDQPSHTPLQAIEGRPPDMVAPAPGCRFAPRCARAQPDCLTVDPGYIRTELGEHQWCCHYPVGSSEGDAALARNLRAGITCAGLALTEQAVS